MSAEADLRFLRQLQRLLEEGLFTSTYKFALLQALADIAVERDPAADGSLLIPVSAIAEKLIEYYWRQALPYSAVGAAPVGAAPAAIPANESRLAPLLQSTSQQAAIINLVAAARATHDGRLAAARADSAAWPRLCGQVADVIRRMPLWKLQVIGREPSEFLYRRADFADDQLRLLPGVPRALRSFHGLITALVRAGWVEQVQRIPANRPLLGEAPNLAAFLFGNDRESLTLYRDILRRHQASRCFYCGRGVGARGDLDHFIPWSRYPVDLGHNFVFAHADCNRAKRDYLAHHEHLHRWREQNLDAGPTLSNQFQAARLPHDQDRSRQIAWWAYEQGEAGGAHAWLRQDHIEVLAPAWRQALQPPLRRAAEPSTPYPL